MGAGKSLQTEVTMVHTRQDDALKHVQEYVEACQKNRECSDAQLDEHKTMLQEILITQQAYNKLVARVTPFIIVIFTAVLSVLTSWLLMHI